MAAGLARQRSDSALLARAVLGVGATVVTAGKVDWALVALLEEAETMVTNVADRARLQSRRAIELYWYGGGHDSRDQSRVALVTARVSRDKGALGVALHARQFTLRSPEHLDERVAIGERLIGLAGRGGHDDMSFQGTVWLAADVMRLGQLPRFRALVGSLEAMAARARRSLWRWYATVMRAQLAAVDGEVDDAYAYTEAAATLGRQLGVEVARAYHLAQLCVLDRERRGLGALSAQIEDAAAGLPYFVTIRGLSALAAATSGRRDAANWEVERLSGDGFAAVPRDSLWVATIALLLEAAAISGSAHTGALLELLAPHRGTFVVQGLPNCWGSVDRFVGRGYLALDQPGPAAECLAAALDMESKVGAPLFVARTRLDQARLAMSNGDTQGARALAAQVWSTADRLELVALADEAAQLGDVPTGARAVCREREVLALLSGGSSNKDIASDLVISINTVERHLANIYTKLDVRSRAEAAAYAVRAGVVKTGPVEDRPVKPGTVKPGPVKPGTVKPGTVTAAEMVVFRDGAAAVDELLHTLFMAFPDFTAEARQTYHGDEIVFVDTVIRGTHGGDWAGVPATGRSIEVRCGCVFHFDNGRLVKETVYFDHATLLAQISLDG